MYNKITGLAEVGIVNFKRIFNEGVMHAKLWTVDRKHFYLGSANMNWRSLTEVTLEKQPIFNYNKFLICHLL